MAKFSSRPARFARPRGRTSKSCGTPATSWSIAPTNTRWGRRARTVAGGCRWRDPRARHGDGEAFAAASHLRVISRYGVGVDSVDVAAATARGVVVTITPGANAVSVAELAIALLLVAGPQHPVSRPGGEAGQVDPRPGHRVDRRDDGAHRAGPDRPGSGAALPWPGDAGPRLRPVADRRPGCGVRRDALLPRGIAGRERRGQPAPAAHTETRI